MENRGRGIPELVRLRVRRLLIEQRSVRDVAQMMQLSRTTVQKIRNELFPKKPAA